uniref:glycogen/starch/alpha-glucan phosphorylase n=1 Tax=Clostridium sp. Ade.TY TaxID=1391647 RepID=UPI000550DF55
DNNFIFGLEVEEIESLRKTYNPKKLYEDNKSLKRVIDTLIDGTFDDGGSGDFEDLYNSLIEEGDQYFLLADFESFKDTEDKVFDAYKDENKWAKMAFENVCNAGIFSSDRTIQEYCDDIWGIKKCTNK